MSFLKYPPKWPLWPLLLLGLLIPFLVFPLMIKRIKPEWNWRLWFGKYRKLRPYIEAQAQHETGDYTSKLAKEAYNLFGMKIAHRRKQVKDGTYGSYARYKSYDQSIRDLLLWFDSQAFPNEVGGSLNYVENLKVRGYFEDSTANYVKGINHFLNV